MVIVYSGNSTGTDNTWSSSTLNLMISLESKMPSMWVMLARTAVQAYSVSSTSLPPPCFTFCSPLPCPPQHLAVYSYGLTRRGTETTKAKPNFTVSTIMLRRTYICQLCWVSLTHFTLFINARLPRAMLFQLRAHHLFDFLETVITFHSQSQVHQYLLLHCRRIFFICRPD